MSKENVSKTTSPLRRKAKRAGLVTLGLLVLALVIAVQSGYAGYGWAHLWASVFPRDESLLSYVPKDTTAVAILDGHQLKLDALGGEESVTRTWLTRTRKEIKDATGIDIALDIDKLMITPSLAVGRGRFDEKDLVDRLAEQSYRPVAHEGRRMMVRSGEDAVAVIDDSILLYGDEASLKAAFDAKKSGASLEQNEGVTARLRAVGWDHPLLVSVRMADDRPSIRSILTGGTGPKAVTVAASTKAGLDLVARIDAASPAAGEELKKLLDEKRQGADELAKIVGSEPAGILLNVAKKATIAVDPKDGVVSIRAHVDPAELDALGKALSQATPLTEMYKNVRLLQLLGGG